MNGLRSNSDSIYLMHFTLGLFAVLFALGVHSLIFIYFLGTGRWVKEVALAYGIADAPLPKLTRDLKRAPCRRRSSPCWFRSRRRRRARRCNGAI